MKTYLLIASIIAAMACKRNESSPLVKGGDEVKNVYSNPEFPSLVALATETSWINETPASCTGVYVSQGVVVTAAHCISAIHGGVVMMGLNSGESNKNNARYSILKSVAHPQFSAAKHDIGYVTFSSYVPKQFVPAQVASDELKLKKDEELTIVGYGVKKTDAKTTARMPMKTILPFIELKDGLLKLDASKGSGACYGDSGGPAYYKQDGKHILVGITQGGEGNCGSETNRYTDIRPYVDWLEKSLNIKLNR